MTIDEKTGEYTYAPKSDFNGKEEFTVLVDDGNGGRVEIIVPVTVTPVNDAPSLENDEVTVSQSLKTGSEVYDINDSKTGNDFDIDGDEITYEITYEIISGNTSGLFVIDPATGKITITPGKTLDSVATPEGGYKLTIKGTDSSDEKLTDESVITIKVDGESSKITTSIESMGKIEGETFRVNKGPVILKITGTDQDGQPISFTREVELTRPDGSGTGTYTYQITKDDGIAEGSSVNVEASVTDINNKDIYAYDALPGYTDEDHPGLDIEMPEIAISVVGNAGKVTWSEAKNGDLSESVKEEFTVTGTSTGVEAGQVVTITFVSTADGSPISLDGVVDNNGEWSVTVPKDVAAQLLDGSVSATVKDRAGNTKEAESAAYKCNWVP